MAQYAAHHTERLGFLIAHRPGFVAPTLAARKIATFDHLTEGRIAIHIIAGASDAEQEGDGDFAPKEERYRRAAEYIEVMKLAWTAPKRFDFSGDFYKVRGAKSDIQPFQKRSALFFALVGGPPAWSEALRRVRHVRRAVAPTPSVSPIPRPRPAFRRDAH